MELKYLTSRLLLGVLICSNRTFMELKFLSVQHQVARKMVLIAPLWN